MARHILVGDIHGCNTEFQDILSTLRLSDEDTLVSLGDILDKNTVANSVAAVQQFRGLFESRPAGKTIFVKGNHEIRHEKFRRHHKLFKEQGKPVPMKRTDELFGITELLSEQDIAFLDTVPVLYHKIPEHNALVVHAGVPPSVTFLPPLSDIEQMTRSKQDKYNQLLRVRFVDPDGHMVPLGDEQEQDVYWAEKYDGRFGTVFYGHQPYHFLDQPKQYAHAVGLDLGAVFGNLLCAAVLEADQPVKYVMVKARSKYAPTREEDIWEK